MRDLPCLLLLCALGVIGCGGGDELRRPDDLGPDRDGAPPVALDAGEGDGATDAGPPVLDAEAGDALPDDGLPDGDLPDDDLPDGDLPDGDLPPEACPDDMVLVPAGDFRFGNDAVVRYLPAYCVDITEVSAGDYLDCVDAGACDGYEGWALCAEVEERSPHQCQPDKLRHPANWIDWFRAEQYCRWAGKRLPDEGQWEKAARGVDGRTYPWGEVIGCRDAHVERGEAFDACRGVDGLPDGPVAVTGYADVQSPYGAINLVGNVREWLDQRVDRSVLPEDDAPGLAKGGEWRSSFDQVMNADRDGTLAVSRSSQGHGFRCTLDLR